ncbi:MAG: hypothetical protein IKZ82_11250 [Clostridia bacterium]|nr:hypothetical protein [Clostridia bacterium]
MKRAISIFLCALMLMMSLVSCAVDIEEEEVENESERLAALSEELLSYPQDADFNSLTLQLQEEGFVISEVGTGITGYARLCEFYNNTQNGRRDALKFAQHYPEEHSETGEERLLISALYYSGEAFTQLTRDVRTDEIERGKRLNYFKREKSIALIGDSIANVEHFYLVNKQTADLNAIMSSYIPFALSSVAPSFPYSSLSIPRDLEWSFVITVYYGE